MQIYGNKPAPPFAKPCWGDMLEIAKSLKSAGVPFILIDNGYTEKKSTEIHHDHLIKDFIGIEEIISKYLNH